MVDIFDFWVQLLTLDGEYNLCDREIAFKFKGFVKRWVHHKSWIDAAKYSNHKYDVITPHSSGGYQTPYIFNDAAQLREYFLCNKPSSIDVGPIYIKWKEIYRAPLVFDIDSDAYDDLRTCRCNKGKSVCNECWTKFMAPAMAEILDKLENVYKFKNVQTFFSGRRGLHIWVFDKAVWEYDSEQRSAIRKSINTRVFDELVTDTPHAHLVKLPLALHPVTKRRAIPIDLTFLPDDNDDNMDDLDRYTELVLKKIKDGRKN